jgi:dihydrofolate reductase
MRRIVNSTYISLDGVIERPHEWPTIGLGGSRAEDIQTEHLLGCDALLMGRRTYETFAAAWPTRSGDPFSDHINAMPKYVVSSTLTDAGWSNTSIIGGDPVAAIERLKQAPGGDIVQYGFGQLSFAMLEHGLLDELRLWVHPLFVGRAEPADLLHRDSAGTVFDLADITTLDNGIVILAYRVANGAGGA